MKPGIYHDISNEDYHGGPGLSKSGLDKIAKSPAHYFAAYLDPNRPPRPDPTPAMLTGTLAHCAILEPGEFDKRFHVGPDVPTKAAKAWKDFEATLPPGVIGIKPEQHALAFAQREAVMRLPDVAEAFTTGFAEASVYWVDESTGVLCKCRPDWVYDCGDAGVVIFDVKTTQDASPDEFRRSVAKWSYHKQAAWYSDGFKLATGRDVLAFVFVAVENEWPHFCSALMLDDEAMAEGRRACRSDLDLFASCTRAGKWPGYSSAIETISLPAWALTK